MQTVTLSISKKVVYNEIEKTTSYAGQKMAGEDATAYQRMRTVDDDSTQLDRFWDESKAEFCKQMKGYLVRENNGIDEATGVTEIGFVLELSDSYDTVLKETMQQDLVSFFVLNIIAKWFTLANKTDAAGYKEAANNMLIGIHKNALHRKRPTRPTY